MEQRNLFLAIALSLAILLGFQMLLMPDPPAPGAPEAQTAVPDAVPTGRPGADVPRPAAPGAGAPAPGGPTAGPAAPTTVETRTAALAASPRLPIRTPRLTGSIALRGGRVDDLVLTDYRTDVAKDSPPITLFSPTGTANPYYADFGWTSGAAAVPGPDTVWRADRAALTPDQPVTLTWDNGQGLRFTRRYDIDRDYMLTVTQTVENAGGAEAELYPFGLIARRGTPETSGFFILHEGPLGVLNGTLKEVDYDDLQDEGEIKAATTGGWIGITDKFWLAALIPDQAAPVQTRFVRWLVDRTDKYQVDVLGGAHRVAPGARVETVSRLFAGAKEVRLLDRYAETFAIPYFDKAVDFGWFYFLTKPIFYILDFFFGVLGNFGLAILLLTVIIKAIFFPLANKSYRAMSKLKLLQPKMVEIREKFGDDRARMNQEMMALYKREKANPMAGCLPMLVQIPVFFALYKVLFVTIEMRHAPFYGWIADLSAPDPLTVFNLFGLIPWTPPEFMAIGIWPLIMGLTMFLQQKISPQPADPTQQKVFLLMPVIFTFLLARFPAGLVIYWAWNNVLSILQQWVIMRRMGVKT